MFCFRSLSRQRSWMLSVIWILPLEDLPCWSSRWGDTRGQAWSGPRMVSPFWPETATSSFTPTPSRLLSSSARWILSGRSRCFADWNGLFKNILSITSQHETQCDHMAPLFAPYLAIYNYEKLPNSKNYPRGGKFGQIRNKSWNFANDLNYCQRGEMSPYLVTLTRRRFFIICSKRSSPKLE